jgi:F0F1-type ATP synthase assembly protein I
VSPRGSKSSDVWAQVAFYTSLGAIIPGGLVGGYLLGWLLDEHFHTAPIFGIIGGGLGTAGGIAEVIQLVLRASKSNGGKTPSQRG